MTSELFSTFSSPGNIFRTPCTLCAYFYSTYFQLCWCLLSGCANIFLCVQASCFRICSHLPRRYISHISGFVHIYLGGTIHIFQNVFTSTLVVHSYFSGCVHIYLSTFTYLRICSHLPRRYTHIFKDVFTSTSAVHSHNSECVHIYLGGTIHMFQDVFTSTSVQVIFRSWSTHTSRWEWQNYV